MALTGTYMIIWREWYHRNNSEFTNISQNGIFDEMRSRQIFLCECFLVVTFTLAFLCFLGELHFEGAVRNGCKIVIGGGRGAKSIYRVPEI